MSIRDSILDSLPRPVRRGLAFARQDFLEWAHSGTEASVINHHGIKLRIGDHLSPNIIRSIVRGEFEGGELKPLRMHLVADDRVFEVGTGIGFITLFCAKLVGEANVFTYEANPESKRYIVENFQLNSLEPVLTIGFLTESGEKSVRFFAEPEIWSSSAEQRSANGCELQVPTVRLSSELAKVQPTFLIVDIEGGEYDLFRQMSFDGIRKIVVELHPQIIGEQKSQEVRQMIERHGFRCGWACDDELHFYYER